jgi:hypothetical protein
MHFIVIHVICHEHALPASDIKNPIAIWMDGYQMIVVDFGQACIWVDLTFTSAVKTLPQSSVPIHQ